MVANDSFNDDPNLLEYTEINIPRSVRFYILLLFDIPSIACSFVLLFHLLLIKTLRNQLINHVMIILLLLGLYIQLIDVPLYLHFLRTNIVEPSIPSTCLIWWFIDYGLYSGCTIIMAWGSIQRYLLIFYDRFFITQRRRLIFHYLPFVILLVYIFVFYLIAIVFPPCENVYNYRLPLCNEFPCYLNDTALGTIDTIVNNISTTFMISLTSLILVVRVYYRKRRLHQVNIWRKQRKMTIQLLCNSILYIIPNIPFNILVFARICGLPKSIGIQAELYADFALYFVTFLYPFVCLASQSELRKKISLRRCRLTALVEPR